MYLQRAYGAPPSSCNASRTEGFAHGLKDSHRFSLKHYTRLSRWRPGRNLSRGPLQLHSAMQLEDLDAYRSDSGSSSQSRNSEKVPKYGQWNSDSNATVSDYEDYRIGVKKSTGGLIRTIVKVLHYILISLIFISISCRILFEYTSFTRGKLIMCRNAADFESSMMVSRMVSFFLIAMIYDLLSRFLLNIYFSPCFLLYQVDWSISLRRT